MIAVVNLDMPILTYDFPTSPRSAPSIRRWGRWSRGRRRGWGSRLSPDPLPEEGLFTRSDHYKFVRAGVPSVFLMTGFAGEGAREFRRFLDTRYHSPSDDLSQAVPLAGRGALRPAELSDRPRDRRRAPSRRSGIGTASSATRSAATGRGRGRRRSR